MPLARSNVSDYVRAVFKLRSWPHPRGLSKWLAILAIGKGWLHLNIASLPAEKGELRTALITALDGAQWST